MPLFLYACSSSGEELQVEDIIELDVSEMKPIVQAGGSTVITFKTNTDWSSSIAYSRSDNWCSIVPESGTAGMATVTITADKNTTYDERKAVVQLKAGSVKKELVIIQEQNKGILLDEVKREVEAKGGDLVIEVKSNVDVYCTIENGVSWINMLSSRALSNNSYSFLVEKNESEEIRSGKIYFYNDKFNLKETFVVEQKGKLPPSNIDGSNEEYGEENITWDK